MGGILQKAYPLIGEVKENHRGSEHAPSLKDSGVMNAGNAYQEERHKIIERDRLFLDLLGVRIDG